MHPSRSHSPFWGKSQCSSRLRKEFVHSQNFLTLLPRQNGHRTSTGDDTKQVIPSADNATAVLLDQLLERDTHFLFDDAGVVDVAGDAEELGALVSLTSKAGEPLPTSTANRRGNRDRFDVSDGGRAAEEAYIGREGGLQPWLALLALDTLYERGLLSTDVRASTTVEVDVEVVTGVARVLANETIGVGLIDGLLYVLCLLVELATNVDVCSTGVHSSTGDQAAFDEFVGITTHNFTVFACPWFTFISIHDQVSRSGQTEYFCQTPTKTVGSQKTLPRVLLPVRLVHEAPFETGREAGTSSTAETRVFDGLNNPAIPF